MPAPLVADPTVAQHHAEPLEAVELDMGIRIQDQRHSLRQRRDVRVFGPRPLPELAAERAARCVYICLLAGRARHGRVAIIGDLARRGGTEVRRIGRRILTGKLFASEENHRRDLHGNEAHAGFLVEPGTLSVRRQQSAPPHAVKPADALVRRDVDRDVDAHIRITATIGFGGRDRGEEGGAGKGRHRQKHFHRILQEKNSGRQ